MGCVFSTSSGYLLLFTPDSIFQRREFSGISGLSFNKIPQLRSVIEAAVVPDT